MKTFLSEYKTLVFYYLESEYFRDVVVVLAVFVTLSINSPLMSLLVATLIMYAAVTNLIEIKGAVMAAGVLVLTSFPSLQIENALRTEMAAMLMATWLATTIVAQVYRAMLYDRCD